MKFRLHCTLYPWKHMILFQFISENAEVDVAVEVIARANSYCENEEDNCGRIICCNSRCV